MFQYIVYATKLILPFLIPCSLNIGTHFLCNYIGCDTWYSLLGYNLACNACIDAKKLLKDHQLNMYWSIGSIIVSKMDLFMGKEIIEKVA
tara:strand:- start:1497 stop:1766 length:270 start_codon:yes stop_codon:yes gene_type:complete